MWTLARQADKYNNSKDPKTTTKAIATRTFLFHTITIIRNIKQVVTNITVMTARPKGKKKTHRLT